MRNHVQDPLKRRRRSRWNCEQIFGDFYIIFRPKRLADDCKLLWKTIRCPPDGSLERSDTCGFGGLGQAGAGRNDFLMPPAAAEYSYTATSNTPLTLIADASPFGAPHPHSMITMRPCAGSALSSSRIAFNRSLRWQPRVRFSPRTLLILVLLVGEDPSDQSSTPRSARAFFRFVESKALPDCLIFGTLFLHFDKSKGYAMDFWPAKTIGIAIPLCHWR